MQRNESVANLWSLAVWVSLDAEKLIWVSLDAEKNEMHHAGNLRCCFPEQGYTIDVWFYCVNWCFLALSRDVLYCSLVYSCSFLKIGSQWRLA